MVGVLLIAVVVYKYTDASKLLAPRVIKREPQIEDFIVRANDQLEAEGGAEVGLNPVVQARFLIEQENRKARDQYKKRGAGAYGALRKLGIDLNKRKKHDGAAEAAKAGLNVVDAELHREAIERQRAEREAVAFVQQHQRELAQASQRQQEPL